MDYDQLRTRIATSKRAKFGTGVSEDLVQDAESVLGITFPASYRWWLLNYGGGYLAGHELNGLCGIRHSDRDPDELYVGDIIAIVFADREDGKPRHLLQLITYEGDETYYLDMASLNAGEAPVVCIIAGESDVDQVATTFGDFLAREL